MTNSANHITKETQVAELRPRGEPSRVFDSGGMPYKEIRLLADKGLPAQSESTQAAFRPILLAAALKAEALTKAARTTTGRW